VILTVNVDAANNFIVEKAVRRVGFHVLHIGTNHRNREIHGGKVNMESVGWTIHGLSEILTGLPLAG
jgi:hypothetical protein